MSTQRKPSAPARSLCAEYHPDDGINPKELEKEHQHRKTDRKLRQLCAQIRRALHQALPAGGDERLFDALVESVDPAPDASRLLVTVSVPAEAGRFDPAAIIARLDRHRPRLRAEVAGTIHRKRAPELAFRVIPRQESSP